MKTTVKMLGLLLILGVISFNINSIVKTKGDISLGALIKVASASSESSSSLYLYALPIPAQEYEVEVYTQTEYCVTTVHASAYISCEGNGDLNCISTSPIYTTGIWVCTDIENVT